MYTLPFLLSLTIPYTYTYTNSYKGTTILLLLPTLFNEPNDADDYNAFHYRLVVEALGSLPSVPYDDLYVPWCHVEHVSLLHSLASNDGFKNQ